MTNRKNHELLACLVKVLNNVAITLKRLSVIIIRNDCETEKVSLKYYWPPMFATYK